MAATVGKFAANRLLKQHMKGYQEKRVEGGDDPFFAMVEDPKRPGKFKKVKKQIPAYIPEQDAMVLASVRKMAYRMDMCLFNIAGIRFGWESVIGIIPAIGDVIGVMFALLIWKKAQTIDGGLDTTTSIRMLINIAIDFVVGLVPFIGDLADAAFKCNTKNARLLEIHLDKKYRPRGTGLDDRNLAGVDKERRRKNRQSGIYHPQDPPPATAFEDFDDEEEQRRHFIREQDAADRVNQPQSARVPEKKKSYGWFTSGGGGGARAGSNRVGQQMAPVPPKQETGSVRG